MEYERLQAVLLGSEATIREGAVARPSRYRHLDLGALTEQQAQLAATLRSHGVRVHSLPVGQPLFARDLAVVAGSTFIVCHGPKPRPVARARLLEALGDSLGLHVLRVDAATVEGGDILFDGEILWVGQFDRTDERGRRWLQAQVGSQFETRPLHGAGTYHHLDLVLSLLPGNAALIFPPAFDTTSMRELERRYELIPITAMEQFSLGANLLFLSEQIVISEARQQRINALLAGRGLTVIALNFREIVKLGGGFRCATCPLERG